jgi:hypothetical protein
MNIQQFTFLFEMTLKKQQKKRARNKPNQLFTTITDLT